MLYHFNKKNMLEERAGAIEQHSRDLATLRTDNDNAKKDLEIKTEDITQVTRKLDAAENMLKENANGIFTVVLILNIINFFSFLTNI